MKREFYLDLAKNGLRFPVGADLILHEHADHEEILRDGARLGEVVAAAAARFKTPIACPVMDLMLEKAILLRQLGIPEADIPTWHFSTTPSGTEVEAIRKGIQRGDFGVRMQANIDAVRYIATRSNLIPCGMSIGPFSLMTKLLAEPITPVYLAGTGLTGADDPDVKTVEVLMALTTEMVLRSFRAQAEAGAKIFFIAEPAANQVFISPNQIAAGSDVFERLVMASLRRIKAELDRAGVDLFFHCCGELIPEFVRAFGSLDPAILSLGSSRQLWEDAALLPKTTVLYGNLPSKKFYSDDLVTVAQAREMSRELAAKMKDCGHPFILGTECDVLSVKGCEKQIMAKIQAVVDSAAD